MFTTKKIIIFILFFAALFAIFTYALFALFPVKTENALPPTASNENNVPVVKKATSSPVELTEQKIQAVMQQEQKPGGGLTSDGQKKVEDLMNLSAEQNRQAKVNNNTATEQPIGATAEGRAAIEAQMNAAANQKAKK